MFREADGVGRYLCAPIPEYAAGLLIRPYEDDKFLLNNNDKSRFSLRAPPRDFDICLFGTKFPFQY